MVKKSACQCRGCKSYGFDHWVRNIPWRRKWHPTPVLLPGKCHGWRSLVGAVHGVLTSRTWLSNFTFSFHFHALEKGMVTHSSILTWRIPGTAEPGGLLSVGSHRVGHDWSDLAAAAYNPPNSTPTKVWCSQWSRSRYFSGTCLLFQWSNGCCQFDLFPLSFLNSDWASGN